MLITGFIILLLAFLLTPVYLIRFHKRCVAKFNLAVTNRITGRFAGRWAGFGIMTHRGRKSGKLHRTPMNVFPVPEGFLIALTYGRNCEWVKNVIAAEGCEVLTRGVSYQLSSPVIVHDPSRKKFPIFVRLALRVIGAKDYMQLTVSS
jgi:deazaflavin-dependent oxidoreductase (nitroreductase family)